jgi:hypothetical protein
VLPQFFSLRGDVRRRERLAICDLRSRAIHASEPSKVSIQSRPLVRQVDICDRSPLHDMVCDLDRLMAYHGVELAAARANGAEREACQRPAKRASALGVPLMRKKAGLSASARSCNSHI